MTRDELNQLIEIEYQQISKKEPGYGTWSLRELLLERISAKCSELNRDRIGNAIHQWWIAQATVEELRVEALALRRMAKENKNECAPRLLHYAELWETLALLRERKTDKKEGRLEPHDSIS
jgi:hypothetical protein